MSLRHPVLHGVKYFIEQLTFEPELTQCMASLTFKTQLTVEIFRVCVNEHFLPQKNESAAQTAQVHVRK